MNCLRCGHSDDWHRHDDEACGKEPDKAMTDSESGELKAPREHELKCWPSVFAAIREGLKRHEFRRDDRDFKLGDILVLNEWEPKKGYTGDSQRVRVTWITRFPDFETPKGYCVMSIEPESRRLPVPSPTDLADALRAATSEPPRPARVFTTAGAAPVVGESPRLMERFSDVNYARCVSPDGFNHPMESWSPAEWTNAIAGEAGEACNLAKKLIRHRDGVKGNKKAEDQDVSSLKRRCAEELADVVIYADLAIRLLGFDMEQTVIEVFNRKSRELGAPFIAESFSTPPVGPREPSEEAVQAALKPYTGGPYIVTHSAVRHILATGYAVDFPSRPEEQNR